MEKLYRSKSCILITYFKLCTKFSAKNDNFDSSITSGTNQNESCCANYDTDGQSANDEMSLVIALSLRIMALAFSSLLSLAVDGCPEHSKSVTLVLPFLNLYIHSPSRYCIVPIMSA